MPPGNETTGAGALLRDRPSHRTEPPMMEDEGPEIEIRMCPVCGGECDFGDFGCSPECEAQILAEIEADAKLDRQRESEV